MKQYYEKFVQYFPTLVAGLTERKLFDSCLKRTPEHLKEVRIKHLTNNGVLYLVIVS